MKNGNLIIMLGNLGKDPKSISKDETKPCAVFDINIETKGSDNPKVYNWYSIITNGKVADACLKYIEKGSQVLVTGSLETRLYKDKDGVERKGTQIRADFVKFLSGKSAERSETSSEIVDEISQAI